MIVKNPITRYAPEDLLAMPDGAGAGVRLIWIVNPETRSVTIYRPDGTATIRNEKDTIECEDVLPGFQSPVSGFFPDAANLK